VKIKNILQGVTFVLSVLFLSFGVSAAKIALVPTSPELEPLADKVLASMSSEDGVEFLERGEIEKALREHKLSAAGLTSSDFSGLNKIIHADLFAVISARKTGKETRAAGLIVYDARNGLRLVNTALSAKNQAEEIVKLLRQALKTVQYPKKRIFLSVAAIRDAGVPERFKYQTAFIAAELERRLGYIPGAAVLERDYLDSVNRERELTGQLFKLAPSARLVRLEFSPGSSPEIVNLTLRITDAANKELFSFSRKDCLKNTEETALETVKAISGYLKTSPPRVRVSAAAEAARFFAEYQFLNRMAGYSVARRKLNAALALAPGNLQYRLAEMKLNRAEGETGSVKDIISAISRNLKLAEKIKRDFPGCRGLYSPDYFNFYFSNKQYLLDEGDVKTLAELAGIYRPENLKWIRDKYYKFDLSDGINSFPEWKSYNRYCAEMCRFYLYWDADLWLKTNEKNILENQALSKDFFSKHPNRGQDWAAAWLFELLFQYRNMKQYAAYGNGPRSRSSLCRDVAKGIEKILSHSDEYISRAKTHPLDSVRICGLQVTLLKKTLLSDYDPVEFKKNLREYRRQISAGGRPEGKDDYVFLSFFAGDRMDLMKIVAEVKREAIKTAAENKEAGDTLSKAEMQNIFNQVRKGASPEKRAAEALRLMPQLRKCFSLSLTDPEVRDFFLKLRVLATNYATPMRSKVFTQLREAANHDVEIRQLHAFNLLDSLGARVKKENVIVKNAVWKNNELYFLLCREKFERLRKPTRFVYNHSWGIGRMDLKTGKFSMAAPWSSAEQVKVSRNHFPPVFCVADDFAAADCDNTLRVFAFPGGSSRKIGDLPSERLMGLSLMDGRLYVFVGRMAPKRTAASETILFSCKPDGSDRSIHISTSRDAKQNELDRQKPFIVYSMTADEAGKRLLFNCDSPNRSGNVKGLWEYYPASGKGRCLFDKKYRSIGGIMTRTGDRLYFSFSYDDYCIYDLKDDKGEVFFSTVNRSAKNYLKVKSRAAQGIFYCPPFFARPGQIWFGGDAKVVLITLPDIKRSPWIIMPNERLSPNVSWLLFPHPDRKSAVAVSSTGVYKLTPNPGGMETVEWKGPGVKKAGEEIFPRLFRYSSSVF
jgi:hypothetical protein